MQLILELREALQQEFPAPVPHIHSSQAQVASPWSATVRIICLLLIILCPALALTLCPRPAFRLVLLPGFSKTRLPVQDVHPGRSAILDLLFFQLA